MAFRVTLTLNIRLGILLTAVCVCSALIGCTPNRRIMDEGAKTPEPIVEKPALPQFETDIEAMRTADFNYIYVFRRKDGGVMTAEDKTFFSSYTPIETNRRKLSDGEKAVILGSNFRFPPDLLKILSERFELTDLSKPESEIKKAAEQNNSNSEPDKKTDN